MPSHFHPFYNYSTAGSIAMSISTAPVAVQVSTAGGPQGLLLSNLSTVAMQVLIAPTNATTLSTISTSAFFPGMILTAGVSRQITVSCPPGAFVSGMTTGTGLAGLLVVSVGEGII